MGEDQICGRKKLGTEQSVGGPKSFVRNLGLTKKSTWGKQEEHKQPGHLVGRH